MNCPTTRTVLLAACVALAAAVTAADRPFPVPPPSAYVDAESSVNVPLPTDQGRRIRLTVAFDPTPSNAVQVAFGNDRDGSQNLEPEETELVLGVDCGEPFARNESKSRVEVEQWSLSTCSADQPEQEGVHHCSTSSSTQPSTFTSLATFNLKQPRERWNLAKVTTHNLATTNLTVFAEFYNRGKVLFLR